MVAGYSSLAISATTVTPVFILNGAAGQDYPLALGFSALLTFIGWTANIGIYVLVNRGRSRQKQTWRYVLSYFFCILVTFGLFHRFIFPLPSMNFHSRSGGFHFHMIVFLAVDTVILMLQDLIVIREKNAAMELENSRLKLSNAEAVNLQLKQQVQPHFLFNSLSTLKSLIAHSPEQAEEYLVRLSGVLRYAVTSQALSVVKVARELDLCIDYLEMQRIRFGEALQFTVDVPAEVRESFYLPIFSLQLLVENAIKHNILTREQPLFIRIGYQEEMITIANNLQKKQPAAESAGIGLINLRERYRSLTGDNIVIDEEPHQYSVSIKVFAYESSDH
jgi:two-component system, LytTR family, sensor kinase